MLNILENVPSVNFKKNYQNKVVKENNSKLLEIFYNFFRQTSCVGTRKFG